MIEPPTKFSRFIRYRGGRPQPWVFTSEAYWLTGKALEKMSKELEEKHGIHPVHTGDSIIEIMKRLTKLEMNLD